MPAGLQEPLQLDGGHPLLLGMCGAKVRFTRPVPERRPKAGPVTRRGGETPAHGLPSPSKHSGPDWTLQLSRPRTFPACRVLHLHGHLAHWLAEPLHQAVQGGRPRPELTHLGEELISPRSAYMQTRPTVHRAISIARCLAKPPGWAAVPEV